MANDSSTPGYLLPGATPAPLYGNALDDVFHGVLQGIVGLSDGSLVRPRWQPEPPNQPDFQTDWVAFGITITKTDVFPYMGHSPAGYDIFERDEVITMLNSFYGPNGQALAGQYNDGIQVEQNRDALTAVGIKLVECQEVTQLPALLKERWVKRFDCRTVFRRRIHRTYPILNVIAGTVVVDNEHQLTYINASKPA